MKRRGAKANMEDAEGESTSKTARSDSEDPFYYPYCESDVTLVVEGKKLHIHKAVLSLHSPVFSAMFTANFAEKGAKETELSGKKYDTMLQFLLQMYPVHSAKPITDDNVLVNILPLAEEYQSQHVRVRCEAYFDQQLQYHGENLSSDRKLLYLLLCEQYSVKEHLQTLLTLCSMLKLSVIETNEHFKQLTPTTQMEVLNRRCRVVENLYDRQQAQMTRRQNAVLCICRRHAFLAPKSCGECGTSFTNKPPICPTCIERVFKD